MRKKRVIQTSFAFDTPISAKSRRPVVAKTRATPGRSATSAQPANDTQAQAKLPLDGIPGEAARALLERRIAAHLKNDLTLVVTDNRYSIITVRREGGGYRVRLHHMFLDAEPAVVRALARYIEKSDARASKKLNAFIDANQDKIKSTPLRPPRRLKIRTQGRCWDLQTLFEELNQRYFEGALDIQITWGRRTHKRPKKHKSIKMGSYSVEERLIRIHPALDRSFVPKYFIESVVYHEMLHHIHPIPIKGGRRQFHTKAFHEQEKTFPYYEKAKKWERANIDRLLFF
jgi:predicted metal-dependent hydrolase